MQNEYERVSERLAGAGCDALALTPDLRAGKTDLGGSGSSLLSLAGRSNLISRSPWEEVRLLRQEWEAQEQKAKATEEHLRGIVANTPECIKIVAADGTLVEMNQAGLCMVEADSAGQVIGQNVYDIIAPEYREAFRKMNERVCAGHRETMEFDLIGLKGTRRRMETTAVPIANPNGQGQLHLAITRDITKRTRAEEELRRMKDQLARANEELEKRVEERTALLREAVEQMEEFSYSVSHDLRSPIRAMQGYAQAIAEDYSSRLDANGKEYLDRIIQSGSRMERLIHDILTYSRVSRLDVTVQPVRLGNLVRDIVGQYPELAAPRADIAIQTNLPTVLAHEPSLGQALSNLLNNAVKFVAPGVRPRVQIKAARNQNRVKLSVKDNGIGVKPQYQRRLFTMFDRIHPAEKYEGNGIGLAIVRKAVERMGGKAGMDSDGEHGSTFWIELPAAGSDL